MVGTFGETGCLGIHDVEAACDVGGSGTRGTVSSDEVVTFKSS